MPNHCGVDGCLSIVGNKSLSFFRCPKNTERCQRWKNALGYVGTHRYADITPDQCYNRIKVCSLHFSAEDFVSETRIHMNAVPSVLLPTQKFIAGTTKIYKDSQVQTEHVLKGNRWKIGFRSTKDAPLKKMTATILRQEICKDDVYKFLEKNYPDQNCKLLKIQLSLLDKASKGSRYTDEFKQFALSVYFLGPKAYQKFSTVCRMPSKSTLQRFTNNWIVPPGFNDFIFRVIEFRIGLLKEKENDCVLCLDEVSLRSHLYYDISKDKLVGFQDGFNHNSLHIANRALTVMVKGLTSNWKLPLAYFFCRDSATCGDLKDVVFTAVRRCSSIGLNVLGVVSDQCDNFQDLVKTSLNLTEDNPIFYVDDHKLVYLFEIPHLLTTTWNEFYTYSFSLSQKGQTSKQYLVTMYDYEKSKQYRLAPKLTQDHIYPNKPQRRKVELASQVFSHSVAVAMHTYIDFNVLPKEASATANFIERINDLFDLLNTSNFEKFEAFMGTEKQLRLIQDALAMFQTLVVENDKGDDVTDQRKFIFGWKLTLKSVLALWDMLKERNYKYLFTRNLSQENFFGNIRNQNCCGNVGKLTPMQFSRAFKKLFASKFFDQAEVAEYKDGVNEVLLSLTPDFSEKCKSILDPTDAVKYSPLKVFTDDYKDIESPDKNALGYITKYLLERCLNQHSCQVCIDFYNDSKELINDESMFHKLQASSAEKMSLSDPRDVVDHVILMENIFIEKFSTIANEVGMGHFFKGEYSKIPLFHPCQDFPFDDYISLFIRVRIYFTLKILNKDMKKIKKSTSNLKFLILKHL